MAYRADIEIAVRGAQELKRLQDQVSATSKLVDGLNNYLGNIGDGGVVRSINNLNAAVAQTAAVFNKAALGTEEATIAAKEYLTATNNANAGLREKANLLAQIQAKETASRRRTVPGDAGTGQQTPALPPQLIRTYEIGKNWVKFFQDAAGVAVDLGARALNTKANWNDFFATAAQAAVNVKANSLNTKASWNDFFATAAQAAVNVKANSLNTKASWNTFFTQAAELADDLTAGIREIEGKASAAARQRLADAADARRNATPEVIRRPIAGLAAPAGMGPVAPSTQRGVVVPERVQKATEQTVVSQKRLNNLLNSAQIAEQAILQASKKGLDTKDTQTRVQNIITELQQLGVTATKAELSIYDDLLNLIRNELKLKKAIAATDAASAKATKDKTKAAKETKKEFGIADAIIGGAFPLLFGQGAGASLGGALGGGLGAKFGGGKGGFGGSLVGTLAGQATIDFAINSAVKLGQALQDPTERIDELIGFLGIAGTELNSNIKVLRALGLSSTASAAALAKLESALQKEGFKNAQEFSKDLQTLGNAFGRLQLAAANLAAGSLPGILDYLTEFIKRASEVGLPEGGGSAGRAAQVARGARPTRQQLVATNFIGPVPDPQSTAERVAQKAVSEEKQRQISLARAQKQLEADTLSLTRVDLATRQGAVAIQQVQNDLARKQLEYKNETTKATKELLGLEVQVLEQQRQQAVAAQRNAQIEAQRQVQRQLGSLLIEQTDLENEILTLRTQSARLLQGEAVGLASALNAIETRRTNELGILYVRRDLERLGVNEVEVLQEINTKYDGLASAVQHKYNIEKITLEQQQAQYNLTQLQVQQQRELLRLQTTGQAQLQIQQLQSFADPTGIGFFGDALLNQKLALEEYSVTVQNYNAQLLALESRMAVPGLNPDVLQGLEQEAAALKDVIAVYTEYQPAIIQARLEQEKFNAIFSAVSPLVDNVFNSFNQLIAGTMSAKEAFASFLSAVSDMLLQTAKQMIAQYIAIGIARIFAGMGGGGGGFSGNAAGFGGSFDAGIPSIGNTTSFAGVFGRAEGGPTTAGTPYLVGERGPELFVPGTSGGVMSNSDLRSAMNSQGSGAAGSPVLNMSFESTTIGGVEYVSRDQLEQAMAETRRAASRDGAQRGMTMTLDRIQNSSSTRRRVGI